MYTALTPDAKQKKLFHRVVALMLSLGMMLNWILQVDFTTSVIRANADGESDNLYFNSVQTTIPSPPQVAITNYDYIITTKDEKYTGNSIDTPQPVFNVTASPDTSIDLSLVMNYVFNSQSDLDNIKNNGGYIYYQLPTNLTFDQNYFGSGSKVKDRNYANERWGGADVPSGYYSIWNGVNDDGTKTNPLLVIRFTPDYINYFYNKKYLEGSVEFDGKIYRAETIEGDQTLDFANGPKIQVDFAKDKVTMYKENAQAKTDTTTGAKYLEWKVTITNPKGRTNLTGYTLSDLLNNETFALTSTNCDVSPSDSGYFKDDGTYVFSGKGEGEYHEYYTFTYRQDNPTAGTDYTNKATLKNGDETVTSEATGKLENKLQVEKSGKPDYQDTGERNDSINWKITLENKSGNSLSADKVYLVDPAFRNYKDGTLKVVDADGATMSEDTDYKIVTGKVFYRDGNGNLTDITDVGGADSLTADTNAQIILIDDTYYYITKYDLSDDVIVVEGVPYFKEWNGNADMSSPVRYYKIDTNETEGTTKVYGTRKWNTEDAWVISNNNIIKSSVLQFMGDSATPSATITYSTEVTGLDKTTSKDDTTLNSVSQTNQVFTGSTSESPPTNTSYSASVEYKNELVLLKKEADDGFDEETETFKWKIKVYANASYRDGGQVNVDYNSLETIDGYTVEDAMFKSLTEEELNNSFNCIMNNGSETTEYCKYVTISKVTGSDTKITFTIDKDKMAKDGKTGIISGIELFYNTTAANTLDNTTKGEDGLTEYERYQKHIAVTKTNTATARNENGSYSSSDGVGITAQTRYSAQKSFTDQKTTIIEQDVSQDTQPLNWKIALIKDQGFSKESVVLVDNLGSSTTKDDVSVNTSSKVLHYMTSEKEEQRSTALKQ